MNKLFEILRIFEQEGYECYIIGGFVRDYLLGKASQDLDLTTNAPLKFIKAKFEVVSDIGEPFGNLKCKYQGITFEVTKFRIDLEYNEKRQPKVQFVDSLEKDLQRRDFTINTICLNSNHQFIDILNGKHDLDQKIIRVIGDPMKKFKEDPLRIYRMFRFAVKCNCTIEPITLEAAYSCVLFLNSLNKNLVYAELKEIILNLNAENLKNYTLLNDWVTWLPTIEEADLTNLDDKIKIVKNILFKDNKDGK